MTSSSPQEPVHTVPHLERSCRGTADPRFTFKDQDPFADHIDEVDVVIDHHDADLFSFSMMLDHPGDLDPLLDIEMCTGFIENIHIRIPGETPGNGNPLQFAATEGIHRGLEYRFERERFNDLVLVMDESNFVVHRAGTSPHCQRYRLDVLGFVRDPQGGFHLPGCRGFHTGKEFCKGALSHTICPDNPKHFPALDGATGDREMEGFVFLGHRRDDEEIFPVGSFVMRPLLKDHLGSPGTGHSLRLRNPSRYWLMPTRTPLGRVMIPKTAGLP